MAQTQLDTELEQLANSELASDSPYASPLAEADAELEPQFEALERRMAQEAAEKRRKLQKASDNIRYKVTFIATRLKKDLGTAITGGDFYIVRNKVNGSSVEIVKYKGETVFNREGETLFAYEHGEWEQKLDQIYQKFICEKQREDAEAERMAKEQKEREEAGKRRIEEFSDKLWAISEYLMPHGEYVVHVMHGTTRLECCFQDRNGDGRRIFLVNFQDGDTYGACECTKEMGRYTSTDIRQYKPGKWEEDIEALYQGALLKKPTFEAEAKRKLEEEATAVRQATEDKERETLGKFGLA